MLLATHLLLIFLFYNNCYQLVDGVATIDEDFCPTGCKCAPDPVQVAAKLVICDLVGGQAVMEPISKVENVRSLFITCEPATNKIPENFFKSLKMLHHLRIEGCDTTHLDAKIFEDLSALRKLEIRRMGGGNGLDIAEEVIMPLGRLEKFSVTETPNLELPERLLCAMPNLQVLNLSINGMPTLRRDETCIAQQLLIVDLSRNELSSVEQFLRGAPAIRQLSISNNKLEVLDIGASTPFLQQLDAEANRIHDVENSLPETLVHVNLAKNRLAAIPAPVSRLPHLVALNVSANFIRDENSTEFASNELESLDASSNQLSKFPSEWLENCEKSIAHLRLAENLIADLESGQFSNATGLQTLDLSSNRISLFRDDVLPKSVKLTTLKLGNNSLKILEAKSLDGLKLDQLDLSRNELTEVPSALGKMTQLKRLDLSGNRIGKLYQYVLNKISQLHFIDLSKNQLQSIGPYVFTDSADLHTIDLSDNDISLLFKDSFGRCPKLRKIILKDNRIKSIDEGLAEASGLKKLDISGNQIVILKWNSLPENLEHLNADNNQINLLTAANVGRSNMKTVSLAGNRLNMLTAEQIPNSVEMFGVADNRISHIAKSTLANKSQLRRLDLSGNQISEIGVESVKVVEAVHPVKVSIDRNPLECTCKMTWILENFDQKKQVRVIIENRENVTCSSPVDGRVIGLDKVTKKDMLCQYQQVCEPECICCQYGNCDCKSVCPASCRCFRDEMFEINLVKCERNQTIQPKREFVVSELPVSATEIYLSGVVLPQLRTHSFIGRLRLQRLHINGTGLRSIQAKAFHTLPALKTLDLSDNALISLTGDEFLKTPEISQLFLNGNRFSTLSRGVFDKLTNLRFLTLHNNSFEDIPLVLSNIPSLNGISLSSNPLRCDCASKQEQRRYGGGAPLIEHNAAEWMSIHRHLVVDAAKVVCVENVTRAFMTNDTTILSAYPPNVANDVFVMPIDEFLRDYNVSICVPFSSGFFGQDPQNSIIFVALAVALAVLLLILVILGISFVRKSQDAINQRRYKASSLNCSTSAGSSPLPMPLLSYHAFVSYSKKDEKMIVDQLCRPLEDEDYQLCLLHRDGPTYNSTLHTISDELIGQMDSAQCLILVLTRNFLENEWNTLQIKTSHQIFARNRAKRVIAVLGEGVDANLLDDELGQILRKHTRIDMKSHLFWTLLHSSLPSRMPLHPTAGSTDDSSQVYSDIYGIVPSDVV